MESMLSRIIGYRYYIKYEDLAIATVESFKNDSTASKSDKVNIYIDVFDICKTAFQEAIPFDRITFVAAVVNLGAYMRRFYKLKMNTYATIFYVYGNDTSPLDCSIYPEFRKRIQESKETVKNRTRAPKILNSIKMMSTVISYLPDCYFVEADAEPSAIIASTINNEYRNGNTNPNIILSRNELMFQLVAFTNSMVLYKHPSNGGFVYVNKSNVYYKYMRKHGKYLPWMNPNTDLLVFIRDNISTTKFMELANNSGKFSPLIKSFHYSDFHWFFLLTASSYYGFKSLWNGRVWDRGIEILYEARKVIPSGPLTIDDIVDAYKVVKANHKSKSKETLVSVEAELGLRYKVIDLSCSMMRYMNSSLYNISYRSFKMDNPDELKFINDHYFTGNNYLMLEDF